jgi:UDP-N-acetylglucosamine acyltransferase
VGADVEIGAYSVVGPHVTIGDQTRVMPHVVIDGWTTVGQSCTIFPFASIGGQTQDLKYKGGQTFVEIGDHTTLREYVTVNSGTAEGEVTRIGSRCHIMAYCHVAHKCAVGNGIIMANGVTLAGEVVVEDEAVLGGLAGVHQFVRIGRLAMVGAMSKLTQDLPPFTLVDGNPAVARGINQVGLQRHNIAAETITVLKHAFRILYRENLSTRQAVDRIRAELQPCPELEYLLAFIAAAQRGIIK